MQTLTNAEQQWQDEALASFFNIVEAPDGDFDAIDRLASTLNDDKSLKLMIEFLSRYQQGKQAFIERPLLGDIIFSQLLTLPQNTLGYVYGDHMTRNGITRGWTMAQRAEPLFGIRWNTLWETPLQDIRTSLNIIPI